MESRYSKGLISIVFLLIGIDLKGSITHIGQYNPYMYSYEDNIQRIIYIGDTIYTLSNNKVVATNLNTMKKYLSLIYKHAE